ncbi:SDR family oxidoreductase [Amycolatopsis sp. NPDC048633]|uniref:SDR family oxidoreductase n=1 Tax=Amycolatopsis sp. NPDC048633 TaxID=3157095 RepID=UPI0033F6BE22
MHVFVTGGSGQTGPTVVAELLSVGHTVTGLARSNAAASRLESLGATALRGSLEELGSLRGGAEAADGVLHMAFGGDFADPDDLTRRDTAAIEALGRAAAGKPFISTSGTLVLPGGRESTERDEPDVHGIAGFRIPGERVCRDFGGSVVRLAPTVHGPEDHGFVPMLVTTARESGVSAFVGDGANRWPAVHRRDAAILFRLALEQAPAGSVLHGVAENVTFKRIAETIGRKLGLPAVSLAPEEAAAHFPSPFMARVFGFDGPVSSAGTRRLLGWEPAHAGLLEDLETGDYFTGAVPSPTS